MKKRMMQKIAVLVTGSALALSFPIAGAIADPGGVPHNGSKGKAKQHTNKGKHKGQHKQNGPNGPNGGPSCPEPFPGLGNQGRVDLPNEQAENGQKCGFTGGLSDAN